MEGQQSSSEQEDPESKTSRSNSAAVVLGPGLGSSVSRNESGSSLLGPGCGLEAEILGESDEADEGCESLEEPGTADILRNLER